VTGGSIRAASGNRRDAQSAVELRIPKASNAARIPVGANGSCIRIWRNQDL